MKIDVSHLPNSNALAARLAIHFLEHPDHPDLYRRHPDPMMWYSEIFRQSRDQELFLSIMLYIFEPDRLLRHYELHKKNWFLFWNYRRNGSTKENHGEVYNPRGDKRNYNKKLPDLMGPGFATIYLRFFYSWRVWPVLLICDFKIMLGVLFKRMSKMTRC